MSSLKYLFYNFRDAIDSCNSIIDYKEAYREIIANEEASIEKNFTIGARIAEAFDLLYSQIMQTDGTDINSDLFVALLETTKETILTDNIRLKDVLDISLQLVDDEISITYIRNSGYKDVSFDPSTAKDKSMKIKRQTYLYHQSILSSIITTYETYLEDVFKVLLSNYPNKYFDNKTIPTAALFSEDVKDLLNRAFEQEVSSNMYNSLKALSKIKEKNGIDIDRYCNIRSEFEEIYYRRNLFVHSRGIVDEGYLSNVNKKIADRLHIGDHLQCTENYFDDAITTIKKVIFTIYYELLLLEKASSEEYKILFDTGFEILKCADYGFAEHIFFILRRNKSLELITRTMSEINYLISLEQQQKSIHDQVVQLDVSAMTLDFKIAKECLLGNFENVYHLLDKDFQSGDPSSFDAHNVRDWPIFIEFRKSEFYIQLLDKYKESFAEYTFNKVSDFDEQSCQNIQNDID